MAVDEVALSIAENGYYPQERLLVVAEKPGNEKSGPWVVVEGNRRLAAVQLLVDAKKRAAVRATDLPEITRAARSALALLPVDVYADRKDLWTYLGFRHINGTRPWDAFSKAKYVADVHEKYGIPLEEIAERIGDRHSTVSRLYRGLKVLEQAEEQAGFDIDDRIKGRFSFSHLYTAVDQGEFQRFLGITSGGSLRRNPVPSKNLAALSQLMIWLYGKRSTGTEPVVRSQNPDLNRLREVLASSRALSLLRTGLPLVQAHQISLGDDRRFREALNRAHEELMTARGTVATGYGGVLSIIDGILANASRLKSEMDELAEAGSPTDQAGRS
jgi:hypothetical protein